MSDAAITPVSGGQFTPRTLVAVRVSSYTVNLYPVVNETMEVHERAHAYHVNKAALAAQTIPIQLQLDALGNQLNLAATMDGVLQEWTRYFQDHWAGFRHLKVLSFHDTKGDMMSNTTNATDPARLLPVQDGNVADCCKQGVKFVRVQLRLDLSSLAIASVATHSFILLEEYYIELPQTTKAMNTGTSRAYNLTTWQGHENLKVLSCEIVKIDILEITLQDGPVDLQPAAFGLTSARTEGTVLGSSIDGKIMKLAYATVCKTMFTELCPDYSDQPHAALDLIKQVSIDPNGNSVSAPISAYYKRLMNAARPFTSEREFPISLCAKFIEGMDPRLLPGFRRNFPNHSNVVMLRAETQRKTLQEMLQAAQRAKEDYTNVQRTAREAIGLGGQSFFSGSDTRGASAFPSQAKTTLMKYSQSGGNRGGNGRGERRPLTCFGCGGPHPWSELIDGKFVVKCPNKLNPGVQDNAQKNMEKYRADRKKRRERTSKKRNLATINLADFDEVSQQRIQEQVLQSTIKGDVDDSTSVISAVTLQSKPQNSQKKSKSGYIFIVDVQVLAAGSTTKKPMPITIQCTLPHIVLQLGNDLDCPNCPSIRCAVDTCAALSTGSFHFFAAIAKRSPHCIAKIFAPNEYAPIILSGIVQSSDEAAGTTNLEVGWQFYLPYKTKSGEDAMFAVATGPHVAVNTILGIPFQKHTGAIIGLVDDRVECKYLDCPPFTIDFRRTSNHVPVMDEPSAQTQVHLSTNYSRVIKDIKNLEQFYDAKVLAIRSTPVSEKPTVSFGSKPTMMHPRGPDGRRLDDESESSEGSYLYHDRPDTPEPLTPRQAK